MFSQERRHRVFDLVPIRHSDRTGVQILKIPGREQIQGYVPPVRRKDEQVYQAVHMGRAPGRKFEDQAIGFTRHFLAFLRITQYGRARLGLDFGHGVFTGTPEYRESAAFLFPQDNFVRSEQGRTNGRTAGWTFFRRSGLFRQLNFVRRWHSFPYCPNLYTEHTWQGTHLARNTPGKEHTWQGTHLAQNTPGAVHTWQGTHLAWNTPGAERVRSDHVHEIPAGFAGTGRNPWGQ